MTEENKTTKNKCGGKGKAMFAYGIIQLGSNVVSAVALAAIAFGFCSVKQESKVFNECVEEVQASGKSSSDAVRFCNGGGLKANDIKILVLQKDDILFEIGTQ